MNLLTPARLAILAVLLASLTLLLGFYALGLRVDAGVESLLPPRAAHGGPAGTKPAPPTNETILLAVRSERLFTREGLAALEALTTGAARLAGASRVWSPTNVRDLDGDELGPISTVPYESVAAGEMTPEDLGRRLARHPLYGGLLVSRDATAAAVVIETAPGGAGGGGGPAALVASARELASRAPAIIEEAYVAGLPVEKADVAAFVERDQRIFAPMILGMLAVITALLYRHPAGVAVPLCVVVVCLIWTLGFYAMSGRALNPVTSLLTPVVLVVSVEGAVHLMNHHLAARASGLDRTASLARAIRNAWVPCLNAALTTVIGFGSLVMLPMPAIRDFGLFAAVGVGFSYVLTMTLAPLLIRWLPDFPPRVTASFRPGRVEAAMKAIARWVCRRPVACATLSVVVLALSAAGVARVRVRTDLVGSFKPQAPLALATAFIDQRLTGVNELEILIRGVAPTNPVGLGRVASFERAIETLPGVRKVLGLPDLLARANRAFHGGADDFNRLPEGEGAVADLTDFMDLLRREATVELERYHAGGALRLEVRVTALDTASSQRLFSDIRRAAREAELHDISLAGSFVELSDMSTTLVYNQIRGLVPALGLILLAMAVQFRSARLGLLCVIPNGAPVLMVYGLMGWMGIPLSVPTAMTASVAIGMTVDNTIHLMARFRKALGESGDYERALDRMLDTSGRAVIFSTLTLAAGFWVGAFSSFPPSVHFAVLTGAALLLGLVSVAVLLPLTLILFHPLGRPVARSRALAAPFLVTALCLAAAPTFLEASQPTTVAHARAAPDLARAAAAREITLKDQFGRSDSPAQHLGRTVVLLYAQPHSLRRIKAWELKLQESLDGAGTYDVLRGVDARPVKGKKTEAEVTRRLREGVPPEISILVDWDGALAGRYSLPGAEVTVTVIDPRGAACGVTAGPVENATLSRVAEIVRRVHEKGACP